MLGELATFDPASIEAALRATAEARGVKAATLIHAVRVAVTGKAVSPGLFEVLALLGRDRVHDAAAAAVGSLSTLAVPEQSVDLFRRQVADSAVAWRRGLKVFPPCVVCHGPTENVFLSL